MELNTSATTSPKAHLDEACRILTISSSLAAAESLIERLKALSSTSTSTSTPASEFSVTPHQGSQVQDQIPLVIPYTLSNRYYAADVHFAAYVLHAVSLSLFSNADVDADMSERKLPPAVIFVWADGEPYAKPVEALSRTMALSGYEPEVCLAVRIPKVRVDDPSNASETSGAADKDDDDADIDSTLMSFGFEYVDATRQIQIQRVSVEGLHSESQDEDDMDIPRLPRVLDALSTIMWPSMRASDTKTKASQKASESPSTPLSPGKIQARKERQQERDSIMEELLAVSEISGLGGGWKGSVLIGEVEEVDDEEDEEVVFSPYDFGKASGSGSAGSGVKENRTKTRGKGATPWLHPRTVTRDSMSTRLKLPSGFPAGEGSLGERDEGLVSSPTDMEALSPFGVEEGPKGKKISIGFEDDFTVFVSAPAVPPAVGSGSASQPQIQMQATATKKGTPFDLDLDLSEAGFPDDDDDDGDTPLQTAIPESVLTGDSLRVGGSGFSGRGRGLGHDLHTLAYRSLGSVSDFGGSDVDIDDDGRNGYEAIADGGDGWQDRKEEGEEEEEEDEWEDAVDEEDVEGFEDADEVESWADEEEEGLPTRQEVRETAVRIFGGVPTAHVTGSKAKKGGSNQNSGFERASDVLKVGEEGGKAVGKQDEKQEKDVAEMVERMRRLGGIAAAADVQAGTAAMTKTNATAPASGPGFVSGTRGMLDPHSGPKEAQDQDEDDDDAPPAAFDLENVLHSLQSFRSEIAGMDDEAEKRRLAAKVALGLVYGLQGIDEDE